MQGNENEVLIPTVNKVTIYVHRRKITRERRRIEGWQAGFSADGGGVTCEDRQTAINIQRDVAKRTGMIVTEVKDC